MRTFTKFTELSEFNSDGSQYQLASAQQKTWKSVWSDELQFEQATCVRIEGGVTETESQFHTAIVNVTVSPIHIQNGAEDLSTETVTVYMKDFESEADAIEAVRRLKGRFNWRKG